MRRIVSRRICWPNPDATCLNGGCGYCNDHKFRAISTIRKYAYSIGIVKQRGNGKEEEAYEAFEWGYRHSFANAEIRWVDDGKL